MQTTRDKKENLEKKPEEKTHLTEEKKKVRIIADFFSETKHTKSGVKYLT